MIDETKRSLFITYQLLHLSRGENYLIIVVHSSASLLPIGSAYISRFLKGWTDNISVVNDWVVDNLVNWGYIDMRMCDCGWCVIEIDLPALLGLL